MATTEDYLTVSELTQYLKRKFDADPYLGRIYLTGEISNFRIRQNAHQYFSLKDEKSKISAIMFRSAFAKVRFKPEEGMKVMVIGRISLYPPSGSYQIYVEQMEPVGVGALYQAYEQLKKKLAEEGLFSKAKRPLPHFPRKIAVITSRSGAVIKDIMITVQRRYPLAKLYLFPAQVQGDAAAGELVKRIKQVQLTGTFDVLIIGRGGGSIEDLWPFNEETVVRALSTCTIPVISSVGHETDTTLTDLVADVRAATPTAAAELAVPVLSDELLKIKQQRLRLYQAFRALLKIKHQEWKRLAAAQIFSQPGRLYEGYYQKLDLLTQQLQQNYQQCLISKERQLTLLMQQLNQFNPLERLHLMQRQLTFLQKNLQKSATNYLQTKQHNLGAIAAQLDSLSPLKVLGRGYGFATSSDRLLKSTEEFEIGKEFVYHLADGKINAKTLAIRKDVIDDRKTNI
ncbi:exodeoxyribonuclease VII large subunit [Liquorilactobacillus nagelii]|uniref:exodeoxyribonuclease VII large subunit n=1 Tax=Liquorilactobacillus nagelii TaxID=82688 RepID=UPI0039EBA59E